MILDACVGRGNGEKDAERLARAETRIPTTGVCLVVAVGLTQDLTLILSTKKHQTKQNKENKTQARIHLLQKKVEKDSL